MRIRKYDVDFSRRGFIGKVATGAGAGVLAPLWSTIANSADDITKAYPDELLSIEMYTKGKIKAGDVITAQNVETVKDLLEPITYLQVKEHGRRLNIVESTRDVTTLFNHDYLEVTLKNKGRAQLGSDGNVWTDGKLGDPWIGGLPFPDPRDGNQMIADMTLAWGKHDYSQYAIPAWSMGPDGDQAYTQDFVWCELNTTARGDGTVFQDMKDKLRLQTVFFTGPNDVKGSSFLSVWYYDQRRFPDLYGYFPAFKRVRQFPTNQRFEPLVPGITFFLSDAWAAGDPMLTWGNYRIVERKPFLGAVSNQNWNGADAKWHRPRHGGKKNMTFLDSYFSLVPEAIVLEAEPVGYPRAPVGKKKVWIDARNCHFMSTITTDRRGKIWKQFELGSGQFKNGNAVFKDAKGRPDWSWLHVHSHDVQSNRMSILLHAKEVTGGYKTRFDTGGEDVYNKYLTSTALGRLGK